MWKLQDIKQNEVHKSLIKTFNGRRILFLENDNTLSNAVGNFEIWLRENKMEFNSLFDIRALPLEYIKEQISWFDVIAFETTWTYEISGTIREFLTKSKDKKTILECYICDPTWWRKPKGVIHDMYVLKSSDEDMDMWNFDKLRINKATWED